MKTMAEVKKGEIFQIVDCLDMQTKCLIMRFGLAIGEIAKCVAKVGPIIVGNCTMLLGKRNARKY